MKAKGKERLLTQSSDDVAVCSWLKLTAKENGSGPKRLGLKLRSYTQSTTWRTRRIESIYEIARATRPPERRNRMEVAQEQGTGNPELLFITTHALANICPAH